MLVAFCIEQTHYSSTYSKNPLCWVVYVLNKPPSLEDYTVNEGQFYGAHGSFQSSHFKLLVFCL